MQVAADDGVQAVRDILPARVQPSEQQRAALAEQVGGVAVLLGGSFVADAIRVAGDPRRVIARQANRAGRRQMAQCPDDACGAPVEVG